MNLVDLVIIFILFYFAFEGFNRSLFLEIFELFSFLLAFLLSLRFYNLLTGHLEALFNIPHSLSNVLSFIFLWYVIEFLLFMISISLFGNLQEKIKIPFKEYLSMIPSFFKGLIFVSIILVLVGTFPVQPTVKKEITNSRIGSIILAFTYKLESPLKNVFGGVASDTLTFLTVKPKTNESVDLGFKTDDFTFDENLEKEMFNLVNQERKKVGVGELTFDKTLQKPARDHSSDMFKRGYFSHFSPDGKSVADRVQKYDIEYQTVGENLAFAPNLTLAHQGLMNSPGHKANIISSDFKKVGIGAAVSSEYGVIFTQVFSD